jgi:hypothetical protein
MAKMNTYRKVVTNIKPLILAVIVSLAVILLILTVDVGQHRQNGAGSITTSPRTTISQITDIWRTRHSERLLSCDPSNDVGNILKGHNWNSWMLLHHSIEEAYSIMPDGELRPRVPCDSYWRTGPGACKAVYNSPAFSNSSLKTICDTVLDNGFERAKVIPSALSRREGFPHLGEMNGMNLPRGNDQNRAFRFRRTEDASLSSIGFSYPLSQDGEPSNFDTLTLLKLLLNGRPSNRFAANFGANDGATSAS